MAQVYFHCANTQGVLMDRRGASVTSLTEACEAATCMRLPGAGECEGPACSGQDRSGAASP